MTCRELIDFLMAYLDGELPARESRSFERHLGLCPDCRAYLDSYRTTVRLGGELCREPEGEPPPDIPEDLVAAILEARRRGAQ